MLSKMMCANNGCTNCHGKIRCKEYKEGLIQASNFFNSLINGPPKYKITLDLDDSLVLQNKQVKGMKTNRKYWWISKNDGDFIDIGKIEGNKKLKIDLELENGGYTIGCGTRTNGIRKWIYVIKDEHFIIK